MDIGFTCTTFWRMYVQCRDLSLPRQAGQQRKALPPCIGWYDSLFIIHNNNAKTENPASNIFLSDELWNNYQQSNIFPWAHGNRGET